MSEKPSTVDAAIAAAAAKRAAAQSKHPGIAQHVGHPGAHPNANAPGPHGTFHLDDDDKPTYSVRQVERMMTQRPSGGDSLQTASYQALVREMTRRRDLAMGKLKDIPTEWLEMELQRRKEQGE